MYYDIKNKGVKYIFKYCFILQLNYSKSS